MFAGRGVVLLVLFFGFSAAEEEATPEIVKNSSQTDSETSILVVEPEKNTVDEGPPAGVELDADADPVSHGNKGANQGANDGSEANTNSDTHPKPGATTTLDPNANLIANAELDSDADKVANADLTTDVITSINADLDANAEESANTNPGANTNTDVNENSGTNAIPANAAGVPAGPNGHDDPDYEETIFLPDFVDLDHVICDLCDCNQVIVNCRSRHLSTPFEAEHWNGLRKSYSQDISNVDLSGNHFVTLPQFPMLAIKRLNMSNCGIVTLKEGTFSHLEYLTALDLSSNKMSFAIGKRVFLGIAREGTKPMPFSYLRYLNLAYNDIHSLCQDLFMYMPHLSFLDLTGNPLIAIDQVTMGTLADVMRLKELRMSECELETLPTGIFRRLRSLQRLDLSGNSFSVIPKALDEATNLLYLNFNRNPLESMSKRTAISNLNKLQELHLSQLSKLRSIAVGSLGGLESLVKLNMSHNPRLSALDPKFLEWEDDLGVERWPLLKELYLNNNNISTIDSRFLERWDHLTHVDFGANPYVCDCSNQWVVDVLVPLMTTMPDPTAAKMICRKPYNYRGLSFAQLHESRTTLPCDKAERLPAGIDVETAVLYGVLIGTIVSFPIVLLIVILWKRGCFARYREKMISNKEYSDDEENNSDASSLNYSEAEYYLY